MTASTLLTIDDFERLPAEMAKNHELVDGVLVDVSGNTPRHNLLRDLLNAILLHWLLTKDLGISITEQEYDFLGNAHGPDIAFLSPAKQALLDYDRRVQRFVPDLAIEIISPSDTYAGMMKKKDRYLRAGTQEVWLISSETHEVTVYASDRVQNYQISDTITTPLPPGFSLRLEELFQGL